jgi:colanic acid/amylovoran biosynthesis glycosyltransferase
MGLICIVSDAEGLSENVIDQETGFVVPKRNPELLAQKISEVVSLPKDELLNMSQNAQKRVKENFILELQQRKFIEFYI